MTGAKARHENLADAKSRIDLKESENCSGRTGARSKVGAWNFTRPRVGDSLSAEAEELSLFGPIGRQPWCQTHQRLGSELRGLPALMMAVVMSGASQGSRRRV